MSLVGFDHAYEQVHQGAALARAERCKHAVLLGQQFGAQTRAQLLAVRSDMDLPCAAVLAIYPLVNQTAGHNRSIIWLTLVRSVPISSAMRR